MVRLTTYVAVVALTLTMLTTGLVAERGTVVPTGASPAPPVLHKFPSAIHHVVTVAMENIGYSTIHANHYVQYLSKHGVWFTHYYALCHPSAPNYIARTSGEKKQCGSDALNRYSLTNVVDLLHYAGLSWHGYMENMPKVCGLTNSANGAYVVRHNPFIYYTDVRKNLTGGTSAISCANDVPLTPLVGSFTSSLIDAYTWVTPNITHDCHNSAASSCLGWLKQFLNPFLNKTTKSTLTFSSTVYLVSFDEAVGDNSGYNGTSGGHSAQLLVGSCALVNCGHAFTSDTSSYNDLTTVECVLGLYSLGHNDQFSHWPPFRGAFNPNLHLACRQPGILPRGSVPRSADTPPVADGLGNLGLVRFLSV